MPQPAINALANFIMLTSASNKKISDRAPSEYLKDAQAAAGPKLHEWLASNLISDIHENDGSFTLIETKGVETRDWRMIRDEIEVLWLPEHLDYRYQVEK